MVTPAGQPTFYTLPGSSYPFGIASGPDGRLWTAGAGTPQVAAITTAGQGTSYGFSSQRTGSPLAITSGPSGGLWLLDNGPDQIVSVSTSGVVTGDYTVPTNFTGVGRITAGPDGNLWFTSQAPARSGFWSWRHPSLRSHNRDRLPGERRGRRARDVHGDCDRHQPDRPDRAEWDGQLREFDAWELLVGEQLRACRHGHQRPSACPIAYTPTRAGTATLTGSYSGDGLHAPSVGSGQLTAVPQITTAPQITNLKLFPRVFRAAASGRSVVSGRARQKHPKSKTGTLISYTLTTAATVRFSLQLSLPGRRQAKGKQARCVAQTKRNRMAPRCTRVIKLSGSFTHAGTAGANSVHFTGRLNAEASSPAATR